MDLKENRVLDGNLHEDLISMPVWGDAVDNKLVGVLPFDESFGEDGINVCVYHIELDEIIDGFIEGYECVSDGMLDDTGAEKAGVIISNMEDAIKRLKCRIKDT